MAPQEDGNGEAPLDDNNRDMEAENPSPAGVAKGGAGPGSAGGDAQADDPEWAGGLKKLYDSVVDEPLPDSFKDLLAKLDESK